MEPSDNQHRLSNPGTLFTPGGRMPGRASKPKPECDEPVAYASFAAALTERGFEVSLLDPEVELVFPEPLSSSRTLRDARALIDFALGFFARDVFEK